MISTAPVATSFPSLRPCNVDGHNNCFYNGNSTCNYISVTDCVVYERFEGCAKNTAECDVFGGALDGAGYLFNRHIMHIVVTTLVIESEAI